MLHDVASTLKRRHVSTGFDCCVQQISLQILKVIQMIHLVSKEMKNMFENYFSNKQLVLLPFIFAMLSLTECSAIICRWKRESEYSIRCLNKSDWNLNLTVVLYQKWRAAVLTSFLYLNSKTSCSLIIMGSSVKMFPTTVLVFLDFRLRNVIALISVLLIFFSVPDQLIFFMQNKMILVKTRC